MLWMLAGSPDVEGLPNVFIDVEDGAWYDAPLRWAAAQGIILGVGNGRFAPHNDMTYRHMYLILSRYLPAFQGWFIGYVNDRAPVSHERWMHQMYVVAKIIE